MAKSIQFARIFSLFSAAAVSPKIVAGGGGFGKRKRAAL